MQNLFSGPARHDLAEVDPRRHRLHRPHDLQPPVRPTAMAPRLRHLLPNCPAHPGRAGAGGPDYAAAHDATLVWWDADAVGPHELQSDGRTGRGMYRYVDDGRRYLPGELRSARPRFFDPAGTVLLLADRPPADSTPSYPRRSSRSGWR